MVLFFFEINGIGFEHIKKSFVLFFAAAVRFVKFRVTIYQPLTLTLSPSGERTNALFNPLNYAIPGRSPE